MSKIIQNFKNISYGPAPEDSKDVMSWINSLKNPNHLFINGIWTKSKSSKKLDVIKILILPALDHHIAALTKLKNIDFIETSNLLESYIAEVCTKEKYNEYLLSEIIFKKWTFCFLRTQKEINATKLATQLL